MVLAAIELPFRDRLRLRGLSDAHLGAKASEEKRLKRDIQQIAEEEDSYVILLGDQMDNISIKDPRFQADSVAPALLPRLDSLINAQLELAIRTFEPIKHKIIGALIGNHELKVMKVAGVDVHELFCKELGLRDLGYSCLLRLTLVKQFSGGSEKRRNVFDYCHHGHGGSGRKTGASINRMEDLAAEWDADLYMMGHNHKRHTSTRANLKLTSNGKPRLVEKEQIFIRTGGYLKSFQEGKRPTYSEEAGYSPLKIGEPPYVDIRIEGERGDVKMRVTE